MWEANAGEAANQMKEKISRGRTVRKYRSPNARHAAPRRLDEIGSDELLDDGFRSSG
jgi:hypothetical protein